MLVGAFATLHDNPAVREFWEAVVSTLTDPIAPHLVREFQQSTLAQPVPPAFFETVVNESLKVPARVWQATFATFLQEDWSRDLAKITAPALIVWGNQDAFCPRSDQDLLLAAIPDSQLLVYSGAGHDPHWEEPMRFAVDVVRFIEHRVIPRAEKNWQATRK